MKISISLALIVIASLGFSAEIKKKEFELTVNKEGFEYECHQAKCIEELPNLLFNEINDWKEEVVFNAEFVTKEGNALIFTNPRLSKTLISPETTVCLRYKKNIFGYDMCQELKQVDIRSSLCQMLGLGEADLSFDQGIRTYSTGSQPFLYRYSKDHQYWSRLRLGSMLLPSTNYQAIAKLKCNIN